MSYISLFGRKDPANIVPQTKLAVLRPNLVRSRLFSSSQTLTSSASISKLSKSIAFASFNGVQGRSSNHFDRSSVPIKSNFVPYSKYSTNKDDNEIDDEERKAMAKQLREFFDGELKKWKDARLQKPVVSFKQKAINAYKFAHDLGKKVWEGFKELYQNTRDARELKSKLKSGEELTRLEHQFIRNNRQDLINLIPFFFVWRVPIFGDFILPFFIAKYPELLPSTFRLMKKIPMKQKENIAALKQAGFLKSVPEDDKEIFDTYDEITRILRLRSGHGFVVSAIRENRSRIVSAFGDSSKLDRKQIAALLTRLSVGTRAPAFLLRGRLDRHVRYLCEDDAIIAKEGVDSLVKEDLLKAIMERGLTISGKRTDQLRIQLHLWIQLKMDPQMMTALLIFAHSYQVQDFYLSED